MKVANVYDKKGLKANANANAKHSPAGCAESKVKTLTETRVLALNPFQAGFWLLLVRPTFLLLILPVLMRGDAALMC